MDINLLVSAHLQPENREQLDLDEIWIPDFSLLMKIVQAFSSSIQSLTETDLPKFMRLSNVR